MTDQDISNLFKRYKQYIAEISILQDCIDIMQDGEHDGFQNNYAVLKRRKTLIDHWMQYLPDSEAEIIQMHLIEGRSWVYLSNYFYQKHQGTIPCDERTLQRIQGKALKRIADFVTKQFSDQLDYLIDSDTNNNP